MTANKELTVQTPAQLGFVEKMIASIDTFEAAIKFGEYIIQAGYAPAHFKESPVSIILAIDAGRKLGLDWFQSLQEGFVVNGIPGYRARCLKGLVLASGVCEYLDSRFEGSLKDGTRKHIIEVKRKDSRTIRIWEYAIDNAKLAKLWGPKKKFNKNKNLWEEYDDAWVKYPDNMLESRNISNMCNTDFPDVTKGFRSVEELQDYPTEPDTIVVDAIMATEPSQKLNDAAKGALANAKPLSTPVPVKEVGVSETPKEEITYKEEKAKEPEPISDATIIHTAESLKALKAAELLQLANEMCGFDLNEQFFGTDDGKKKRTPLMIKKIILAAQAQDGSLEQMLLTEFGYKIEGTTDESMVEETTKEGEVENDGAIDPIQEVDYCSIPEPTEPDGRDFNWLIKLDNRRKDKDITADHIMGYITKKGLEFDNVEAFYRKAPSKYLIELLGEFDS